MARAEKNRKEKTTPVGVNLMRSQVLYSAAQTLAREVPEGKAVCYMAQVQLPDMEDILY
jgi:hypothetical protein